MEIFADSADLKEIQTWLDFGVIDGVTTNPSILLAGGAYQLREGAIEIANLLGDKPLSVEVVTDDLGEMHEQAVEMAGWAANIVVKIPIITTQGTPCLGVISTLNEMGIRVNATACMSFNQAILAAKAGATYVSIFAGRVSDEGADASQVVRSFAEWLKAWNLPSKIIVGSIRETINIQDAILGSNEGRRDLDALQKKLEPKSAELKSQNDELEALKKQLSTQQDKLNEEALANLKKQIEGKQKTFDRSYQDFQEEVGNQQQDIASRILSKMAPMIVKYSQDNGFSLIVDTSKPWPQSPVLWWNPDQVDITKNIVDAYNVQSGVAAPPSGAGTAKPAAPRPSTGTGAAKPAAPKSSDTPK